MTTPMLTTPRNLPPKAEARAIIDTVNQIVNTFPQFATAIQRFGAITNDSRDFSSAFTAAKTSGAPIFLPYGTYKATSITKASGSFPNRMYGDGVVTDSASNNLGRYFSFRDTAPSSLGNYNSILTAFNGDWTRTPFPVEHWITGASTLGTPATGYLYTPEAYPFYVYVYNSSGHNESTSGNDGRTAACAFRTQVYQHGQGDAMCYNATAFIDSTLAGSTNFLANPAAALFAGDISAGVTGCYLNACEISLVDNGYDVAGIGWVVNTNRSLATAAKGAYWASYRAQSVGSQPIDTHFSAVGKARFGLDLSFCTFDTNKSAITLKADDRIYMNVTATDATGVSRYPSAVNTDYFLYSSSLSAFAFIVANVSSFQIYNGQTVTVGNSLATVEQRAGGDSGAGVANYTSLTATKDLTTNSTGVGTILFKGATSRNSSGFIKIYIGTTAYYVPAFSAITG